MTGEVQVTVAIGPLTHRQFVQPGMTHRLRIVGLVDGEQRELDVDVSVVGQPCPDPAAHLLVCAETNHENNGDCDGTVRPYIARRGFVFAGVAAGEQVELCANHAQTHGRHIRKADR